MSEADLFAGLRRGDEPRLHALRRILTEADAVLATEIAKGKLHAGTVLAVLCIFRDAARKHDPRLAEELVASLAEKYARKFATAP